MKEMEETPEMEANEHSKKFLKNAVKVSKKGKGSKKSHAKKASKKSEKKVTSRK